MTVAAKHFDPQLGVDIHLYEIPPDPVPVPLPTPHIGIVFDPFDYLPILGGTVQVNGIKRANAGTAGLDTHIPVGGIWMPELDMAEGPQQQDQLFMGSRTVLADGSPFSKLCMPVLDCNMVGMIPPLRPRKPEQKSMSLTLPTAVNVAIPTNVFVGGPPTVSLTALAFDAAFAGLKALSKTRRFEQAMEKLRGLRKRLLDHLPDGFIKCKILRAEPVDIRDGSVVVEQEDFAIPGRLPLTWTRKYRSGPGHHGQCGHGWQTPADLRLELHPDGSVLLVDVSGVSLFPSLPSREGIDHAVRELVDGARLYRNGDEWRVRSKDGPSYVFRCLPDNVTPLQIQSLPIERIQDLCGNYWRFERANGHLLRIQESGVDGLQGRFIEVITRHGHINQMQLHDPATGLNYPLVSYDFSSGSDLLSVADALGAKLQFEYQQHQLVRHTDRNGLSFYYAYNARLQVIHAWGDGGLHDYHFRYDTLLRETEITDSLGHVTIVKFDEYHLPLCEIDPLDGVTVFEYDDVGRTTAVIDPAGKRTDFAYDDHGNLLSVARPDGSTSTVNYDPNDRPTTITAPDGAEWQQLWDTHGLLREQRTPLGSVTRYAYDAQGQLIEQINDLGGSTRLAFDRHGALTELTDAFEHTYRFKFDALGRLRTQINVIGQTTRYRYDDKGRLLSMSTPAGTEVHCEYDAEDQLARYVNESGAETRLEYAGINRLARLLHPDGQSIRYSYDTEEQLIGVINQRGENYRLIRDPLGRIVEEIDYWDQRRHYEYDAAGRLRRSTDPLGRSILFDNDALGRITCKTLPDPQRAGRQIRETFRYDKAGRLIELRNACAHVVRRFDIEGRLIQEVQNGFAVDNIYDGLGNRIQRRTSAGNTVRIGYDKLNRAERITINDAPPTTLEHNALGQLIAEQLSPSLRRTLSYSASGMLTSQAVANDHTPLFNTAYTYDKVGNLVQRTDSEHGCDRYTYDPMGRVLEHTDPAGKIARWLSDAAGDRLQTRVLEVRAQQAIGGSPLTNAWTREGNYEGRHYVFDRAGNLIRRDHLQAPDRPALHLTWDANQRLAGTSWEAGKDESQRVTYGYDPLGRRVFKRNPTHTTWFFWDNDALVAEVKQANADTDHTHEPVMANQVIDLIAARKRIDALRALHPEAQEYVYRPQTFEPFALIEHQVAKRQEPAVFDAIIHQTNAPAVTSSATAPAPPKPSSTRTTPFPSRPKSTVPALNGGLGTGMVLGVGIAETKSTSPEDTTNERDKKSIPDPPLERSNVVNLGLNQVLGGADKARTSVPVPTATRTIAQTVTAWVSTSTPVAAKTFPPVSETQESVTRIAYFHNDPNGCPTRITDDHGNVLWSARYSIWGAVVDQSATQISNPLRQQGQYDDEESGLYYNRHRYYDPHAGQYVSQDPLGLGGGTNLFLYSNGDPFGRIDPFGLVCTKVTVTRGASNEVTRAQARVTLADLGQGTGTNASSRAAARAMGAGNDDAGHILAKILGGSGGVDGVFPQLPNLNRGQYRVFEGKVADMVRTHGAVDVDIRWLYGNGGTRPTGILYLVNDTNGNRLLNNIFGN